jgi:hypothetical protein
MAVVHVEYMVMSEDQNKTQLEVRAPGEWALERAFGPVLSELGEDLKRVYASGRDRILAAGYNKIEDPNDGKRANLRVARDVLWNGAFSESEICAEYFGGIMASSRSEDGKDDSAIQFVDVTKSLSSKQLRLHYVIYNSLNKLLVSSGTRINVGMGTELGERKVWFASLELTSTLGLTIETDLNILHRHGLISYYTMDTHVIGQKSLPFAWVSPNTFGVLLYACAHNSYDEWRDFDRSDFGEFEGIALPQYYCESLEALLEKVGLAPVEETGQSEQSELKNDTA